MIIQIQYLTLITTALVQASPIKPAFRIKRSAAEGPEDIPEEFAVKPPIQYDLDGNPIVKVDNGDSQVGPESIQRELTGKPPIQYDLEGNPIVKVKNTESEVEQVEINEAPFKKQIAYLTGAENNKKTHGDGSGGMVDGLSPPAGGLSNRNFGAVQPPMINPNGNSNNIVNTENGRSISHLSPVVRGTFKGGPDNVQPTTTITKNGGSRSSVSGLVPVVRGLINRGSNAAPALYNQPFGSGSPTQNLAHRDINFNAVGAPKHPGNDIKRKNRNGCFNGFVGGMKRAARHVPANRGNSSAVLPPVINNRNGGSLLNGVGNTVQSSVTNKNNGGLGGRVNVVGSLPSARANNAVQPPANNNNNGGLEGLLNDWGNAWKGLFKGINRK